MDMLNFLKYQTALENNWIHCSYVQLEEGSFSHNNTSVDKEFIQDEMKTWCKERCKGDWVIVMGSILFENDMDANLFKLTFGATSYKR